MSFRARHSVANERTSICKVAEFPKLATTRPRKQRDGTRARTWEYFPRQINAADENLRSAEWNVVEISEIINIFHQTGRNKLFSGIHFCIKCVEAAINYLSAIPRPVTQIIPEEINKLRIWGKISQNCRVRANVNLRILCLLSLNNKSFNIRFFQNNINLVMHFQKAFCLHLSSNLLIKFREANVHSLVYRTTFCMYNIYIPLLWGVLQLWINVLIRILRLSLCQGFRATRNNTKI